MRFMILCLHKNNGTAPEAGREPLRNFFAQPSRPGDHGDVMRIEKKRIQAPDGAFACLAAKMSGDRKKWLPLWAHSADTYGIAQKLYHLWLPVSVRRMLEEQLTPKDCASAVLAASALHDLGKAAIAFQSMISDGCDEIRNQITDNGLSLMSQTELSFQKTRLLPHAAAGEILLMMEGCPRTFAEVIGAHHGVPWAEGAELEGEIQGETNWMDARAGALWGNGEQRKAWRHVQHACLQWMLDFVNLDTPSSLPDLPQPSAVILSGLVIMADWIASNEEYFPLIPVEKTEPDDMEERLEEAWEKLRLPPAWHVPQGGDPVKQAAGLFGFPPNAMQRAMITAIQTSEYPGLMILEAPMGLGKTEAALMAADLFSMRGAGGLFFGLPTQATANAMFDRIVEWGEKQPEENRISIRLAHGMADLNASYRSLMNGNALASTQEDEGPERLIVHDWFRGSKQGLLADFVVGTVDQVLMAALRQKHLMLRHLGLCGKVIIIDECHAYDAYMNQYLEETLRWLGAYRTPVVMLSATLPRDRRAAFLAAYLNLRPRARERMREEAWHDSQDYPILTWTDGGRICQEKIHYDGMRRDVLFTRVVQGRTIEEEIATVQKILEDTLQDGGCAAVVVNTVRRAQLFSEKLQAGMPDATILLLHSRFVTPDRLKHEQELLAHMGRKSGRKKRDRTIVVGTQVIEQSLDFDADVMMTDLCPMDLLMQRIGRLHRHAVHDAMRPEQVCVPRCYVLGGQGEIEKGAKAVYGTYLLMRTAMLLPQAAHLPDDISRLVNAVYDPSFPLPEEPPGYAEARREQELKEHTLRDDALAFRIQGPDQDFCDLLTGSIPSDDEHARAQVRAGEASMDVLLLCRLSSGGLSRLPWLREDEVWSPDTCPCADDSRKMLAQRISFPSGLTRSLVHQMTWDGLQERLRIPEAWESSPQLSGKRLLVLNEQQQVSIGDTMLTYSAQSGLEWKQGDEYE